MKKMLISVILILCIFITACEEDKIIDEPFAFTDDTVVMRIDNIDITYDVYRYYFLSMKVNYETLDKSAEEDLISVCDEACLYFASLFVISRAKGIELDENDIDLINSDIDGYIEFYGEDGYDEMLDTLCHTRNSYYQMLKWQRLESKYRESSGVTREELEELLSDTMSALEISYCESYRHISFDTVE